jgi:hypothetical protein
MEARRGEARQSGELHCVANKGRTSAHDAVKRDPHNISKENFCEAIGYIVIIVIISFISVIHVCYSSACMLLVGFSCW